MATSWGNAFQLRAAEWRYPAGAADFLLAHHVAGPIFNTYEYGGYLIWRLWPEQRVFIDGRSLSESLFPGLRPDSVQRTTRAAARTRSNCSTGTASRPS